jgi:DNA-binding YbaB/EbfC family protein
MKINPFDLLKNLDLQNMQSQISAMQNKVKEIKAVGSAGGDLVKIEVNGQMAVTNVWIEKEAVNPDEIEMLQDLILAAFTDAMAKVKEKIKEELSGITGGMNIPPGFMGF